jgi:hypothetical protein
LNALNYALSLIEEDNCPFCFLNAFQQNEISPHNVTQSDLIERKRSYMLALTLEKQSFLNKIFIRNYDRWGD